MARRRHSVAVVGAGVAGLTAAGELQRAGLNVVVLEGRDRLGGRIETLHGWARFPVERGAEFVHGRPPELRRLLKHARLHVDPSRFAPLLLQDGRVLKQGRIFGRAVQALERRPADDVSLGRQIQQGLQSGDWTEEEARLARQYVEGYMAADVERVSAQALADEEKAAEKIRGDASSRVREGYSRLVDALAQPLPPDSFRLSTHVHSIQWTDGNVRLYAVGPGDFERPVIRADRALITIPLGVWQQRPIRFDPPLEEKRSAARRLGMGPVVKTLLRLRAPLSEVPGLSRGLRHHLRKAGFIIAPGAAVPTWWTVGSVESPVLVGWTGGPAAQRLSDLPAPAIARTAMEAFSGALGVTGAALAEIADAAQVVDWQKDPWSLGAYSWVPAGSLDAPRKLGAPVADTLFFAGEATDVKGYRGTVHGAIETGRRAAQEIIASLG